MKNKNVLTSVHPGRPFRFDSNATMCPVSQAQWNTTYVRSHDSVDFHHNLSAEETITAFLSVQQDIIESSHLSVLGLLSLAGSSVRKITTEI